MSADQQKEWIQIHDLKFESFLTEDQISEAISDLGGKISQDYTDKNPLFIAILNGSYVFVADLLRKCPFPCELSFVKLSSYDGVQSTGEVLTQIGLNQDLSDRHVVILEDIIDTGKTVHEFMKQIGDAGAKSIRLAALLVKPDALQYPVKVDYTGFSIPNKFVVGYGLDYREAGRNLPAIYQLYSAHSLP